MLDTTKRTRPAALLLPLILSAALVTGCASTAEIERAQADAERALQAAQEAQRTAEQALETARAAQQAAEAGENCCQTMRQELDRALERMNQK